MVFAIAVHDMVERMGSAALVSTVVFSSSQVKSRAGSDYPSLDRRARRLVRLRKRARDFRIRELWVLICSSSLEMAVLWDMMLSWLS